MMLVFQACSTYRSIAVGEGDRKIRKYLESHPSLLDSHTGIAMYDLNSGTWLYRYHSGDAFTPASNLKICTLLASGKSLGDSIPSLHYRIEGDTLFFSGAGDPAFLHPDFREQKAIAFLEAFPGQLVLELDTTGIDRFGPGWAWDDYYYGFQAERSSFPVFGNRFWVERTRDPEGIKMTPSVLIDKVQINNDQDKVLSRNVNNNTFYLNPLRLSGNNKRSVVPFITSPELICELLRDTINKDLLCRQKENTRQDDANFVFRTDADSIYRMMMHHSDNFIAEQLYYQVLSKLHFDPHRIDGSDTLLNLIGLPVEKGIKWVDGSGLSRYNQLSPRLVIHCLSELHRSHPPEFIKDVFPQLGLEGTLVKGFNSRLPYVFAKSGSMQGVYCLSGYLEREDGSLIAFSILKNHYWEDTDKLKAALTSFLQWLSRV
jgi:D-alanyl-D-alanine carboxypeptidase/D-alanyl-D-alanine-endopeptidase (penicillin-binding protein 4)